MCNLVQRELEQMLLKCDHRPTVRPLPHREGGKLGEACLNNLTKRQYNNFTAPSPTEKVVNLGKPVSTT